MHRSLRRFAVAIFFLLLAFAFSDSTRAQKVTPPSELNVPAGFEIDLIYNVPKDKFGSWVSLTNGPSGTLYVCDQGNKGLCSVKVVESSDGPTADVTPVVAPNPDGKGNLSGAQGLLYAFDSLWFHRNGGHLYRLTDTNGDGKFDKTEQLPSNRGGGEHGNHAVILSEDGKSIYAIGGNHAPKHDTVRNAVQSWDEDFLLSRMWDGNGHARGVMAPGGWVNRLNPETHEQELVCIGFRNQYDIALNRHGDLFTFDADMEWDMGSPWYRPTRICHCVSGADFGWRSGTGKWPVYFEDSLPPVVNIGPGSPTGVCSGLGTKFPAKYQDAIYALDWTFGTIYAIHMTPSGASYTGVSEPFVTGAPLPVTDAIVGTDGHLYFTVGGRGTQSGLYRVRYTGPESIATVSDELPADIQQARATRKMLERYHGRENAAAVADAWPHLSSEDRFIRNAARVAIESQPVEQWAKRAITESRPQAKITASIALARMGNESHKASLTTSLLALDPTSLSESQTLALLRAYSLCFSRLGRPDAKQANEIIAKLDSHLPGPSGDVNAELVRILIYLKSPTIVEKTMALIKKRKPTKLPDWSELASRNAGYGGTVKKIMENPPPHEILYALMLRNLKSGWTTDQRREYFEFLNVAAKGSGGASFPKFMTNIRNEALANCTDEQRAAVASITGEDFDPVPDFEIKPIKGPGKKWAVAEALAVTKDFKEADFENGRSLYHAATCGKCHRFNGLGGHVGPDLTSIRNKFDANYVVDHIINPSKIISDQYQSSIVETGSGKRLEGLVVREEGKVVVYSKDANAEPVKLSPDDVESIEPSKISQMPVGLLDSLNAEEVRDLLAYLMSGGNPNEKNVYGE